MKTPPLSGREADPAGYLTAAEILQGQLAGYPADTHAHNGNQDLDRLQREHPDWSIQLVDWTDSRGLNEWERKALELSEEQSKLTNSISTIRGPRVTNGLTIQTERLWHPDRKTLVPLRDRGVTLPEMPGQRAG
jgi:hypothetical protein